MIRSGLTVRQCVTIILRHTKHSRFKHELHRVTFQQIVLKIEKH